MSDEVIDWFEAAGRSAGNVIVIVVLAALLIWLTRRFVGRFIDSSTANALLVDRVGDYATRVQTIGKVVQRTVEFIIIGIAFIAVLDQVGVDTTAIIASAGIAGLALSFGAQTLVRDFLTGVLIIIEDQYRVGDVVTLNEITGTVEEVSLRTTLLRDVDGSMHIFPNGEIRLATNHGWGYSNVHMQLRVPYDTEIDLVKSVIDDVGQEMMADEEWGPQLKTAPHFFRVQDFEGMAMVVVVRADTEPLAQWALAGELRRRLKIAFDREGVRIAVPQQVIQGLHTPPPAERETK